MTNDRLEWSSSLKLLLVHCQGEIGKVIVAGALEIPGDTMLEKMNYINERDDALRRFVTLEPRASVNMSVNLLVPPTRKDADAGFIVLQADRAHPMSGSNCMCVVTALLETGRVRMVEPETTVRLDTPAGLVVAKAKCEAGLCVSVTLESVPAFVERLDQVIETPRWGPVRVDIAFGGVYYAIVDVEQLQLTIAPTNARELAMAGMELKALMAGRIAVSHPTLASVNGIAYVMFRSTEADGAVRTCTTLLPGRVDRSPCGTGSSANLATLHARGLARVGERRTSRSIIGGEFIVELARETEVAGRQAIIPQITGRAWIYGMEELRMDPADPMLRGFALSDSWGPKVDALV